MASELTIATDRQRTHVAAWLTTIARALARGQVSDAVERDARALVEAHKAYRRDGDDRDCCGDVDCPGGEECGCRIRMDEESGETGCLVHRCRA